MSAIRLVPRQVQLRLDEPTDAELLTLVRAMHNATTDDAWYAARDALTAVYRSLDPRSESRTLVRVRALREQLVGERTPP